MKAAASFALVISLFVSSAYASEAVRVENASHPTRCAEEDNIYVKFIEPGIRHFTIQARHPAYAAGIEADSTAPDFDDCDQSHDPSYAFAPKDVTLYEDENYALIGHSFPRFWRPQNVDFTVGKATTRGLHLVQLIRKTGGGPGIEILVLYPADGYWRAKPLPPAGKPDTAYGSSFLIGPIEEDGRPFVRLSWVRFDPKRLEFRLGMRNGVGVLRVVADSPDATRLEVTLPPRGGPGPFAALRSMFVSAQMADTADIILDPGGRAIPILAPIEGKATGATFARAVPSHHNTSAPDLAFGDFTR